jgi:hypothetical protein
LISLYGEQACGRTILRDFDLVVANSGGALVAGGLFEDLPLTRIRELLQEESLLERLFDPKPGQFMRAAIDVLPRYVTQTKLEMLREFLPIAANTKMCDVTDVLGGRTELLLLSFDYDSRRAVFTRSNGASLSRSRFNEAPHQIARELTVVDAVHGSSTPPVRYFDGPALTTSPRTRRLWDGALGGYNNPVLAGVCELLAHPSVTPQTIQVLSIGSGQVRRFSHRTAELLRARSPDSPIPKAAIVPGGDPVECRLIERTLHDLEQLAQVMLDDPPDAASYLAFMMLGHKPPSSDAVDIPDLRLVRMNPVLCPIWTGEEWVLPSGFADPEAFAHLAELELDAHEQRDVALINEFARAWVSAKHAHELPNQGIRQRWDSSLDFGDPTFAAAKRRWQALCAVS